MIWSDIVIRLLVAVILGGIIGFERQWKQRTAGLRTNVLVSIGAASFVLFGLISFPSPDSVARLACQIIPGIGFLGAGVIMRDGGNIKGINTAATLWCSAAVGMFAGMGELSTAIIITSFIVFSNVILKPIVKYINQRSTDSGSESEFYYSINIICRKKEEIAIRELLTSMVNEDAAIHLRKLESKKIELSQDVQVSANLMSVGNYNLGIETVVGQLSINPSIKSVSWTSDPQ